VTEYASLIDRLQGISLFLIGMMGSGKSTVGRLLATRLNYHFFDTDQLIEQATQQTIPNLFATEGEVGFRQVETQVLEQIASFRRLVIATGGGIVTRRENWGHLQHGIVVWLDVPLAQLAARLATESEQRPLLQQADLKTTLTNLLGQRGDLYAQADLRITVPVEQTPEQTCEAILVALPTVLKTAS
jgi:shikimate kinase